MHKNQSPIYKQLYNKKLRILISFRRGSSFRTYSQFSYTSPPNRGYRPIYSCIALHYHSTPLHFTLLYILTYFTSLTLSTSLYFTYFSSPYYLSLSIYSSIAPTPTLIDYTSLIAILNNRIQRVLSGFSPLEDLKENRLLKAVAIIREDPDIIISNNYHKKARTIFVKLLSISLKVFFLYAISTTLDTLSKLR